MALQQQAKGSSKLGHQWLPVGPPSAPLFHLRAKIRKHTALLSDYFLGALMIYVAMPESILCIASWELPTRQHCWQAWQRLFYQSNTTLALIGTLKGMKSTHKAATRNNTASTKVAANFHELVWISSDLQWVDVHLCILSIFLSTIICSLSAWESCRGPFQFANWKSLTCPASNLQKSPE